MQSDCLSDDEFEDARSTSVNNILSENINIANESLNSANENNFQRQNNRRSGARNMNFPSSGDPAISN